MVLIGVCGLKGSGKDTLGDYLVTKYGFIKIRFADMLKDIVSQMFNWPRELLEGNTKESRDFRETKDKWWSENLNMEITPRIVLQKIGTDAIKDGFHENIWASIVERKLVNFIEYGKNIVVTDCRFINEIEMIKSYGGKIICVKRNVPEWFEPYKKMEIDVPPMNIHRSEWEWIRYKFDYEIDNNLDKENIYNEIELILQIYDL
jgi:hypothetical protein